jgi:TRAP transporter TAXI family solute receptor
MTICKFFQCIFSCCILLLLTLSISSTPCHAYDLLLGTDEPGTFSFFTGRTICRAVNMHADGIDCKTVPTSEHANTLTNLQGGALDLALVNSKLVNDAMYHSGDFRFLGIDYYNLRLVLPMYRVPISIVVRNDAKINVIADLKGKRVNSGAPLSMNFLVFDQIMTAMGWTKSEFSLFQSLPETSSQDVIAFNNGTIQAMLHIGVHPDRKLAQSLYNSKGKIVGITGPAIDRLVGQKVGFTSSFINSELYAFLPDKLKTLGLETMLIATEDTDDEVVEMVLKSIFLSKKMLRQSHPSLLGEEIQFDKAAGCEILPHSAAVEYITENEEMM